MAFTGLKKWVEDKKEEFMSHVSQEILDRIETGEPMSYEEYSELRMNSYEFKLIHKILDDDALLKVTQYSLAQEGNTEIYKYEIPKSYTDAVLRQHIHELMRRLEKRIAAENTPVVLCGSGGEGHVALQAAIVDAGLDNPVLIKDEQQEVNFVLKPLSCHEAISSKIFNESHAVRCGYSTKVK